MRKNLLYVALIGLTFIFTACPEEEIATPTAYFEVSSSNVGVNDLISFSNLSEDAESYGWNFGDGNISTDISPTHSYSEAGNYTVTLIAYNKSETDEHTASISVSGGGGGEDPVDPSKYYGVPSHLFSDYYITNFETSDHGFFVGSDTDYSVEVIDGHYVCNNMSEEYDRWFSNSNEGPIDSEDYQIEYKMKITSYVETYGSGAMWAMNDNWDHFFCILSPLGSVNTGYSDDSGWYSWSDWLTGGNESPAFNTVTIRKYAGRYYFFRNEVLIHEDNANEAYGQRFGVISGPTQIIEFDEYTIKTIGSSKSKSTSLKTYKPSTFKAKNKQFAQ